MTVTGINILLCDALATAFFFLFFLSSGGWVQIKLKLPQLTRYFEVLYKPLWDLIILIVV